MMKPEDVKVGMTVAIVRKGSINVGMHSWTARIVTEENREKLLEENYITRCPKRLQKFAY